MRLPLSLEKAMNTMVLKLVQHAPCVKAFAHSASILLKLLYPCADIDPPAPELAKKIYDNFSTTLQMCRAGVSLEGIAGSIITQKAISKITEGLHGVTGVTPYVPKTTPQS